MHWNHLVCLLGDPQRQKATTSQRKPQPKPTNTHILNQWKQGQTTEVQNRNTSSACIDGIRKAKGQLELTLPRDIKSFPGLTFHQGSPPGLWALRQDSEIGSSKKSLENSQPIWVQGIQWALWDGAEGWLMLLNRHIPLALKGPRDQWGPCLHSRGHF